MAGATASSQPDRPDGDSSEQRAAELEMVEELGRRLGMQLERCPLVLDKASVDLDGAAPDRSVLVEAHAHLGATKGGQPTEEGCLHTRSSSRSSAKCSEAIQGSSCSSATRKPPQRFARVADGPRRHCVASTSRVKSYPSAKRPALDWRRRSRDRSASQSKRPSHHQAPREPRARCRGKAERRPPIPLPPGTFGAVEYPGVGVERVAG